MSLINFTNLDFDQIKTTIRDYLRFNSNFSDYDFEGSNLSTIIDVLAYNTYISSYNANMITNEVFIDSATLRENVVSLARNIGYVPRSTRSAKTSLSFFVDVSGSSYNDANRPETLTLQRGIVCSSSSFGRESYTFSILNDITVPVTNNIASFNDIEVYEGTYLTTNFTVSSLDQNQRFILPNSNIDTTTVDVKVKSSRFSTISERYLQSDNILNIDSNSRVFFIQEIEDERYELIFGDGIFGNKLQEGQYIEVSYLISSGEAANGVLPTNFNGRIVSQRTNAVISSEISLITINQSSFGGRDIESIDSIRKYAPRVYASQNRAVTASDYEALLPSIYPETESVSVFGGEELNPPQYGKVFLSIKPINGAYLSNLIKSNIKSELRKYSVAGIVPEITDLKYLYIEPTISLYYNTNFSSSPNSLKTEVLSNIQAYARSSELNKFGARFKYSKFVKLIDESNDAITSNITKIVMRRDLRPILNSFGEYEICYGNRCHVRSDLGYNIKSSGFTISGVTGTVYLSDIPNPGRETGTIFLFRLLSESQPQIVRRNVGTIDYVKGEIKLSPINITSTVVNRGTPLIELSVSPYSNDIIGLQDLYLQLDVNNTVVDVYQDQISSGYNISGSNYIVTSSYTNGALVR